MDKSNETLLWEYFNLVLKVMRLSSGIFGMSPEDKITTILQLQAVIFLKENPGLTVGEFAKEFHMSSPAVTQFTQRLVKSGLIKKEIDSKDKRAIHLLLTKKGKIYSKTLPENFTKKINNIDIFYYMPEEDIRTIMNIFKRFIKKAEAKNNE